jgi:hypothetical protein
VLWRYDVATGALSTVAGNPTYTGLSLGPAPTAYSSPFSVRLH